MKGMTKAGVRSAWGAPQGRWLRRRAWGMMTHRAGGWGRSRRGALEQHQWGKLALPRHTCVSFSLLGTVSRYDNVFIPLVNKVNVLLLCKNHRTGQCWLLVPAGVVVPSSIWEDAPTLLIGLGWDRWYWMLYQWDVVGTSRWKPLPLGQQQVGRENRSDPGMGTPCQCHFPTNWVRCKFVHAKLIHQGCGSKISCVMKYVLHKRDFSDQKS